MSVESIGEEDSERRCRCWRRAKDSEEEEEKEEGELKDRRRGTGIS